MRPEDKIRYRSAVNVSNRYRAQSEYWSLVAKIFIWSTAFFFVLSIILGIKAYA